MHDPTKRELCEKALPRLDAHDGARDDHHARERRFAAGERIGHGRPETAAVPLLRHALPWIGHREIRSRGTVCGSLAHADPSAELPAVACCLGARVTVASVEGTRTVGAEDFFVSAMTTQLDQNELATAVDFPLARPGQGFGFGELARRHGDFALAGVAAQVDLRDEPTARVTAFGVADRPVTAIWGDELRGALTDGEQTSVADLARGLTDLAHDFAGRAVTTVGDSHGSPAYRRRVLAHLAARHVATAHQDAVRRQEES